MFSQHNHHHHHNNDQTRLYVDFFPLDIYIVIIITIVYHQVSTKLHCDKKYIMAHQLIEMFVVLSPLTKLLSSTHITEIKSLMFRYRTFFIYFFINIHKSHSFHYWPHGAVVGRERVSDKINHFRCEKTKNNPTENFGQKKNPQI